jgi:hypothetical protein
MFDLILANPKTFAALITTAAVIVLGVAWHLGRD